MYALRAATRAIPRTTVVRPLRMALRFASSNSINEQALPFTHSGKATVRYTEDHEWIALHGDGTAFVGITKYAADALGDATYVEVGQPGEVDKGDSIGSVESVKSASELYSPVAGEVLEGNAEVEGKPDLVNSDPLGAGWFTKLKVADAAEVEELMNLEAYEDFIKQ